MQRCLINTAEESVPKQHLQQDHFQSVFPHFSARSSVEIVFLSPRPQGKWSSLKNDLPSWSILKKKNKMVFFQVGLG